MRVKLLSVFFALACALFIGQAAQAQMLPFDLENMDNAVGVGIGYLPDYVGSDDYMIGGAPFAKVTRCRRLIIMRVFWRLIFR